jgi:CRP-like cAMP-binding protein
MAENEPIRPRVVLASIPFFAEVLDGEEIDILGGRIAPRSFPAGEVLIRENDSGDSMFVIVSGEVDVSIGDGDGGAARRLARLDAGGIVGEMSLMTGARRSATVTAATPVTVLEVTKSAIEPILNAAPALVERFAAMLERRQAELDRLYGQGNWSLFGLTRHDLVMAMQAFFGGTI